MHLRVACVSCLFAFLSIIGMTGMASAQQTAAEPVLQAQIDSIMAPYVAAGDFMGVVGVQRDGEAPLIIPYGLANIELGVPHKATDIFMISSVSKQFTAAAILLLEQDGALKTNDPVNLYLPNFAHGDKITIEQLLTHTSCVADIYSLKRFGETAGREGSFEEVIDELGKMPLIHPPGSAYYYSNGGYALLAAIIERASGTSYGEYLADRIFKRLEMTSTSHRNPSPVAKNRVQGYDPSGQAALMPVTPISAAYTTGSGSLWSSAADLLTWTSALHNGLILNEASYKKLTRDYGYGYGYGVYVFKKSDRNVVGHDGRIAGYASDLARYMDDRVTTVILSNVQSVVQDEVRWRLAAAIFGDTYAAPEQRVFMEQATTPQSQLAGVYSFGPGMNISISALPGQLLARANEGGDLEFLPVSDSEWFSRMLYTSIRFERDKAGSVNQLIWLHENQKLIGHRIR